MIFRSEVAASSQHQEQLFKRLIQEIKTQNSSQCDITRIESMIKYLVITCNTAAGSIPSVSNISPEKRAFLEKKFLQQLKYDGMDLRQETVEEAHKKTFRWIFDRPDEQRGQWDNFQEWLSSPQQKLYWITGKPGAGKSTLMKLICDVATEADPDEPHFILDTGDPDLTVATFFFWAAGGNEMQKSREGLFRTLIHQLLKQHPGLIASTAPDRWEALCLFGDESTTFTEPELRKLLRNCLMELNQKKVLLFIDGLDEFAGRHDDLVHFFFELLDTCSVKLCVSSRPWEIFEESFKNRPSLRISDLTEDDIEAFLFSTMRTSPTFVILEQDEPLDAQRLMEAVLHKAQGVFLWVKLVTRSLIEALRGGETVNKLWTLLDRLPDGSLDDLFHRILQDLGPEDLERAAYYIGLLEACLCENTDAFAIAFSFAAEDDTGFSLEMAAGLLPPSSIQTRLERLKKSINSSCKGLIEVAKARPSNETQRETWDEALDLIVQYPHRSVRDFLESARARAILSRRTDSKPHLKLCSAYLACLKTLVPLEAHDLYERRLYYHYPGRIVAFCLRQAAMIPAEDSTTMIHLVDELPRILPPILPLWHRLIESRRGRVGLYPSPKSMFLLDNANDDKFCPIKFLAVTVVYNMFEYLKHKITLVGGFGRQNRSTISASLARRVHLFKATIPSYLDRLLQVATCVLEPNPEIIDLLLRNGANLHSRVCAEGRNYTGPERIFTIWESVLAHLIMFFAQRRLKEPITMIRAWREVGCLMMNAYGAKVNGKSVKNAVEFLKVYQFKEYRLEGSDGSLSEVLPKTLQDLLSGKITVLSGKITEEGTRPRWLVYDPDVERRGSRQVRGLYRTLCHSFYLDTRSIATDH